MASPAMPVINPFPTKEAYDKYKEYYEMGTKLRVIKLTTFLLTTIFFSFLKLNPTTNNFRYLISSIAEKKLYQS
jgi:hypothetical protein